ncbi:MAG: Glu/Leu/Phe/Val family dehydrogenase [Bdellovibrionales bacterium]
MVHDQNDELLRSHLYRNVLHSLEKAGESIRINPNVLERLKKPRRSIRVSIPVRMDDEKIQIFNGYRVQHNHTLGPFKGGIRYHSSVNMGEIAALASLMTYKNSLLNLPLGGAKGGVQVNPESLSKRELESLTRRFATELGPFIGPEKDIPAPDIGTNAETMAWMLDTFALETGFSQTGVVTGKPVEIGGSRGRESATGLGVAHIAQKALETQNKNISSATFAIQGFGKVGMHAGIEAHAMGAKIVGVSDIKGALYNPEGINISELFRYLKTNKFVQGFPDAEAISNDNLLELNVDVLCPCALSEAIHEKNMKKIKAKIIVEGANGPVTPEASDYLIEKDILIIPDILANGGGVVVSYFEWVQDIGWLFWTETEVRSKLKKIMSHSFEKVWSFSKKEQGSKKDLRLAAMSVSLLRLEKAMKLRGQAW